MLYVRVLVADASFHGKEPLTYACNKPLQPGSIVSVPLKDKVVNGAVVGRTEKPSFKTKPATPYNFKPLPTQLIQLINWIQNYYPAPLGAITQHFVPKRLPNDVLTSLESPQKTYKPDILPALTTDQANAIAQISKTGLHLIHGETGSGKTRVYIELAGRTIRQGRSAIILTPEISLTSQLANEFRAVFNNRVLVLHSKLAAVKRRNIWANILSSNEPLIVIGPRSALLSPVNNVGLIVVDESHEAAYKQENAPHFHASTVAAKLAELHKACLVLGSATPLVTDYFIAKAKQRPVIYLGQIAKGKSEVSTVTVDRRDKTRFSKSVHLSDDLIAGVKQALNKGEQALVFLNRRGTARVILCDKCGWQAQCPHCDLPLTYHADTHKVVCHSCDFRQPSPSQCLSCGNPSVLFKSAGTKAIAEQLSQLFPGANVMRFDTDNAAQERLEAQYASVRSGEVDILAGTQTLGKGLDLPKLSFVGVVDAETSLSFPDFSATEQSYQMLTQVLGRIGRGHRAAKAVVQTFSPDSPLLKAAIEKNWQLFYNNELSERQRFNFPPFCFLLKITVKKTSAETAKKSAATLGASLKTKFPRLIIDGPTPAFHEKHRGQYQWQIIVKSKSRKTLLEVINSLPAGAAYDIDPLNLL